MVPFCQPQKTTLTVHTNAQTHTYRAGSVSFNLSTPATVALTYFKCFTLFDIHSNLSEEIMILFLEMLNTWLLVNSVPAVYMTQY